VEKPKLSSIKLAILVLRYQSTFHDPLETGDIIPHVLSIGNTEQVEIFCQRETVGNLRVANTEHTNQLASIAVLEHSTGAVPAQTYIQILLSAHLTHTVYRNFTTKLQGVIISPHRQRGLFYSYGYLGVQYAAWSRPMSVCVLVTLQHLCDLQKRLKK